MADLAARAQATMATWGLTPDGDAQRTDDALLWPVRQGDQSLMLKVVDPDGDETAQATLLALLDGRSAPRLFAADGPAYLMERLTHTGPTLTDMALSGQDDAALDILIDLSRTWQGALSRAAAPALIPFDRWCRALWTAQPLSAEQARLIDRGRTLATCLTADPATWRPLHGDLHHANALHDPARGWCAIDPKGLLAPPAYDLANSLLNPLPHADHALNPARLIRQAAVTAAQLNTTPDHLLALTTLHACLGLAWSLSDSEAPYWTRAAQTAGQAAGLHPPAP